MQRHLCTRAEVGALIARGDRLIVAGDEALLRGLPAGNWIGGTTPYFVADQGGVFDRDHLFVTEVPSYARQVHIATYDASTITSVYRDGPDHGFSLIVLPAFSPTHLAFAVGAPTFDRFAMNPLVGWVSGVALADLGEHTPKVFSGQAPGARVDGAVVMHVELPPERVAEVGIVNIFSQGDGDELVFPTSGFSASDVLVGGRRANLAEHLASTKADTTLPLTADYLGATINVSIQKVDTTTGQVALYAPVLEGVPYRLARPLTSYADEFTRVVPAAHHSVFSCNCILNYVHSKLEGRRTADFVGPVTFGEIAYQLVNQTLVHLDVTSAV